MALEGVCLVLERISSEIQVVIDAGRPGSCYYGMCGSRVARLRVFHPTFSLAATGLTKSTVPRTSAMFFFTSGGDVFLFFF